ncbi:NAD-dependent epimerase/dehydratase family protein [bacterium]|nr:NAD-dependent epimerase/dehydratase family protein [bacterium]
MIENPNDIKEPPQPPRTVLVTGALGYVGRLVVDALAADPRTIKRIVALDIRPSSDADARPRVTHLVADVSDERLVGIFRTHMPDTVIHLASIVTPGKKRNVVREYQVDVEGTRRVLELCEQFKVSQLVITSSGAAYGYHADNPEWLRETDALRGNDSFPYARHKRLVEEMLSAFRVGLRPTRQLVLRPGTILGANTNNQITDLFDKPIVFGVKGHDTPFVFIWDADVATIVAEGVHNRREGIFNLAGDGVMTMRQIAERLGKPYVSIPRGVLSATLSLLRALRLSQYGPEQIDFLAYRPVLANDALKAAFPGLPRKTSEEVFELFAKSRGK